MSSLKNVLKYRVYFCSFWKILSVCVSLDLELREESGWGRAKSWCFLLTTGSARCWIVQMAPLGLGEQNSLCGLQGPQGTWSRTVTQYLWSSLNTNPALILKSRLLSHCLTAPLNLFSLLKNNPVSIEQHKTISSNKNRVRKKVLFHLHLIMSGETAGFWGQTNAI